MNDYVNKDKLITLKEWDLLNFSKTHSIRTLRAWARTGLIHPKPIKVGREYYAKANAKYISAHSEVIRDPVLSSILNGDRHG